MMLDVEDRFMIKNWRRKGISISEIARRTGYDRKTIRKVLDEPLVPARQSRPVQPYKLGPYIEHIKNRMAEGVFNASKLYTEIKAQGYAGGRTQVRSYVQAFRPVRRPDATVRYETAPGEQAQADWAHFGLIDHLGHQRRLYAFLMTLGWSRTMYLEFTVSADAGWWLRCHLHAFRYFGGAPQVVLHDNLKTAVLDRSAEGHIHWNPRYLDFAGYYGFTPQACQPYRAQTKGKVESGVKYVRINFWPGLHFTDLADLNRQRWSGWTGWRMCGCMARQPQCPLRACPRKGCLPYWASRTSIQVSSATGTVRRTVWLVTTATTTPCQPVIIGSSCWSRRTSKAHCSSLRQQATRLPVTAWPMATVSTSSSQPITSASAPGGPNQPPAKRRRPRLRRVLRSMHRRSRCVR